MQREVTFIGPFTDEDLAYLMQALRHCEQKQPDKTFGMAIKSDDSRPVEDIRDFLKKSFPAIKGTPVHLETFERE